MRELTISLQTLTPIWTGGIGGVPDRLHETGIIGSLRWWYEAIVRGLGGRACDPTSDDKCNFDQKKYEKSDPKKSEPERLREAGLCDACQVFGATGWKRRFRLQINDIGLKSDGPKGSIQTSHGLVNKKGKNPRWFFKASGQSGIANITITSLDPNFDPILIYGTLVLIQNYGGLAAKNQLGYGGIKLKEPESMDIDKFLKTIITWGPLEKTSVFTDENLPDILRMFFVNLQVKNDGIQSVLDLKFRVRRKIRDEFNDTKLRHFVCGTTYRKNSGSKIFYLQAKNKKLRTWGWIPKEIESDTEVSRDQVIDAIKSEFESFGKIKHGDWKEFNSNRDVHRITSSVEFLRDLLGETNHV